MNLKEFCGNRRNGRMLPLLFLPLIVLFIQSAQAHHVNPVGYWNVNGTPPDNVQHCTFESSYLNAGNNTVGLNIYTPPGYETSSQRYPVIYVLHGINGDEYNYFSWFSNIYSQKSILSLIEGTVQHNLPVPNAIVVFANGGAQSFYNNFTDQYHGPNSPFPIMSESIIMNEVIPAVDAKFRTIASRSGRAIEGFSMGGRGALKFALKNPDMFCSVVGYAGAAYEEISQPAANNPYLGPLPVNERMSTFVSTNADDILAYGLQIRLTVGADDNPQESQNIDLVAQLTSLGIPHVAEVSLPGIGHQWDDLYNARGEEGLNLHYECFQAASQLSRTPSGEWFIYLPVVRGSEDNLPPGVPQLTCGG